jgi:hypothetical protein
MLLLTLFTSGVSAQSGQPLTSAEWGRTSTHPGQGGFCGIACVDAVVAHCGSRDGSFRADALRMASEAYAQELRDGNTHEQYHASYISNFHSGFETNYDRYYEAWLAQAREAGQLMCDDRYLDAALNPDVNINMGLAIRSGHPGFTARFNGREFVGEPSAYPPGAIAVVPDSPLGSGDAPVNFEAIHAAIIAARDGILPLNPKLVTDTMSRIVSDNQLALRSSQTGPRLVCPDFPELEQPMIFPLNWGTPAGNLFLSDLVVSGKVDPAWAENLQEPLNRCLSLDRFLKPDFGGVRKLARMRVFLFSPEEIEGRNAAFVAQQHAARLGELIELATPHLPRNLQMGQNLPALRYDFASGEAVFEERGAPVAANLMETVENTIMIDVGAALKATPELASKLEGKSLYFARSVPDIPSTPTSQPKPSDPITIWPDENPTLSSFRTLLGGAYSVGGSSGANVVVLALDTPLLLDRFPIAIDVAEKGFTGGQTVSSAQSVITLKNVRAIGPVARASARPGYQEQQLLVLTADIADVAIRNRLGFILAGGDALLAAAGASAGRLAEAEARQAAQAEAEHQAQQQREQAQAARQEDIRQRRTGRTDRIEACKQKPATSWPACIKPICEEIEADADMSSTDRQTCTNELARADQAISREQHQQQRQQQQAERMELMQFADPKWATEPFDIADLKLGVHEPIMMQKITEHFESRVQRGMIMGVGLFERAYLYAPHDRVSEAIAFYALPENRGTGLISRRLFFESGSMQVSALKGSLDGKYGKPVWSSGNRFLWSSNAGQLPAGGGNCPDLVNMQPSANWLGRLNWQGRGADDYPLMLPAERQAADYSQYAQCGSLVYAQIGASGNDATDLSVVLFKPAALAEGADKSEDELKL